jgi:hypothetical protein
MHARTRTVFFLVACKNSLVELHVIMSSTVSGTPPEFYFFFLFPIFFNFSFFLTYKNTFVELAWDYPSKMADNPLVIR